MRIKYQADADLDARIVRGLRRRQPGIDFRSAVEAGFWSVPDNEVLRQSAEEARVLVTHDQRTMPHHFAQFVLRNSSSGVIVVPSSLAIGAAIEELQLIWEGSEAEEWVNRIAWIPL